MARTIAEALAGKRPNDLKARNGSLEIVHAFVKLHMAEIDGAREMGYSWKQIQDACREMLKENAKASQIIWSKTGGTIEHCYKAAKKGTVPGTYGLEHGRHKKKTPAKKFSVEVTEE